MAKLTDLISGNNQLTFSFEVTPDLDIEELDKMSIEPLFYSITWHAKTHQNKNLDIAPVKLAKYLRSKNKNVLLHMSCDLLRKDFLGMLLKVLQENDIRNLFIILGERYDPVSSDFKNSENLIKSIRQETGDYFCIGIAGSPDCDADRLLQLKAKVDSGANFIITQAFFESRIYQDFSLRCETAGINVPIIPGIFAFETYKQLFGFINMCKIKVSQNILDYVKGKDESDGIPGREITENLIKSIGVNSDLKHFHMFTLNKLAYSSSIIKPLL